MPRRWYTRDAQAGMSAEYSAGLRCSSEMTRFAGDLGGDEEMVADHIARQELCDGLGVS